MNARISSRIFSSIALPILGSYILALRGFWRVPLATAFFCHLRCFHIALYLDSPLVAFPFLSFFLLCVKTVDWSLSLWRTIEELKMPGPNTNQDMPASSAADIPKPSLYVLTLATCIFFMFSTTLFVRPYLETNPFRLIHDRSHHAYWLCSTPLSRIHPHTCC